MVLNRSFRFISFLILVSLTLNSCNFSLPQNSLSTPTSSPVEEPDADSPSLSSSIPSPPETLVEFRLRVPADTPPEDDIYINILDEVTGLALNASTYLMTLSGPAPEEVGAPASRIYTLQLPFSIGSVIKYRYMHQSGPVLLAEHLSDGSAVRYRIYLVDGPGGVDDVVGRWTDSDFYVPTGRIRGNATDTNSGAPIPNLLITAGGAQAISKSDGSFLLEGLPAGVHNLVAYSMDGSYQTFQQGARVAPDSTTPTPISLTTAKFINILFVARPPEGTPPVPLRVAGNLFTLGNAFGNLRGDMNGAVSNMPMMSPLPDGRYSVTLSLPVGADIRYKYTLGDGFWNAEHGDNGEFRVRQIIVPQESALIEDQIDNWYDNGPNSLLFDVTVPENTPSEDFISIQFNPLIGWTEPIPMWRLSENRWGYILFSPLNLPGNFSYRYCRNNQCGFADDAQTPGLYGLGRPITLDPQPQLLTDQVLEWSSLYADKSAFSIPSPETAPRAQGFWTGVEFLSDFHPSWTALMPKAFDRVSQMNANWTILTPSWTYGRRAPGNNPPVIAPLAGSDPLWFDLTSTMQAGQAHGLNIAIFPQVHSFIPLDEWWSAAPRDYTWWPVWQDEYRTFILHHADLAQQHGAAALIIGGENLNPALPDGILTDGSLSGVPQDMDTWWRNLIADIRTRYSGQVLWVLPHEQVADPPDFIDVVDQVYILWEIPPAEAELIEPGSSATEFEYWLDYTVWPFQILFGKGVVLGVNIPSDPNLQVQLDLYHAVIRIASQRDWITGIVSRGYYPPAALQDLSSSIHGKPSSILLESWFGQLAP